MAGLPIPGIRTSDESLVASIASSNPPTAVCGKIIIIFMKRIIIILKIVINIIIIVASIASSNPPTAVCGKFIIIILTIIIIVSATIHHHSFIHSSLFIIHLFSGPLMGAASTVEREAVHQVQNENENDDDDDDDN